MISSGLGSNTWITNLPSDHPVTTNYVSYKASKAALNAYSIQLAKELQADGVKVNCVTPPLVSTNINAFVPIGVSVEEGIKNIIPWALLGSEDKDKTCKLLNL